MSIIMKRVCDVCGNEIAYPKSSEELRNMLFNSQLTELHFPKSATGIDICEDCAKEIDRSLVEWKKQVLENL